MLDYIKLRSAKKQKNKLPKLNVIYAYAFAYPQHKEGWSQAGPRQTQAGHREDGLLPDVHVEGLSVKKYSKNFF